MKSCLRIVSAPIAIFTVMVCISTAHAAPTLTATLTTAARGVFKTAGGTTSHKLTQEEFKQAEPLIQTALDKMVERGVIGSGAPMIPVIKPDLSMEEEISFEQLALYFRYMAYEEDQLIQTAHDKKITRDQASDLRDAEIRLHGEQARAVQLESEANRQNAIAEQQRLRDLREIERRDVGSTPVNNNTPSKNTPSNSKPPEQPAVKPSLTLTQSPAGKGGAAAGATIKYETTPKNANVANAQNNQANSTKSTDARPIVQSKPPVASQPAARSSSNNEKSKDSKTNTPPAKDNNAATTNKDDKSKTAVKK